ncbi:MAG: phosphohydrolase [Alphaproteobacteria bacterium]|nr:phosphohydrolase [Alphaproteobacteria bacterium]
MIEQVLSWYISPDRHYHGIDHIRDCLRQLEQIDGLGDRERAALSQALLWHDAVYDPLATDNEERSAALAAAHCDSSLRDEVRRLVLLTRSHSVDDTDRCGAIMVSIDLSILAADEAEYAAYCTAIQREYHQIPETAYRIGRSRILKQFLERPVIFPYPPYRQRLEQKARQNIAREIADLERGCTGSTAPHPDAR